MKFLLPCTCGRSILIEVAQAGEQVACACGKSQEAPTMRAIRALAPAVEENASAPRAERASWSPLQGTLFGLGALLIFVSAGLAGYFGYIVSQIDTREPEFFTEAQVDAGFENLPIDQAYDLYSQWRTQGLGPQIPPHYILAKQHAEFYTRLLVASLAGAAIGLALAVSSFFVRSRAT